MNKTTHLKAWFCLLLLLVGISASAADADYTLTPSAGSNNSYTGNCDVTVGDITWNVGGNAQMTPWRLGGKSITNTDRTVYSKTAYTSEVAKIDLTVGSANNITVNSLKLVYSTSSDFSNASEIDGSFKASSTITFAPASGNFPANAYYKFVFNLTVSGTSNKFVEFSKVEFYNASSSGNEGNEGNEGDEKTLVSIEASGAPVEMWTGDDFSKEGITITAIWDDDTQTDVTRQCEFGGYNMATAGDQTVTVTYAGKQCEYTIHLLTIANTPETPYTVAQARELIDAGKGLNTDVYIMGIVSQVDSYNSNYGSITYWISEDGTPTDQFEIYGGLDEDGGKFNSEDDMLLGINVVVKGKLKKYGSTYEMDKNNQLASYLMLVLDNMVVNMGDDIAPRGGTNATTNYSITFVSDNENVVLADGRELVTMGPGEAHITATLTTASGRKTIAWFTITVVGVQPTAQSIEITGTPTQLTYTVGESFNYDGLVVVAHYANQSDVDVTAEAEFICDPEVFNTPGSVRVEVMAGWGELSTDINIYNVTVNKCEATIQVADMTIGVGGKVAPVATTTPEDAEVTYTIVSGEEYVSIDEEGYIVALTPGEATVLASYAGNDVYAPASVTFTVIVDSRFAASQTGFTATSGNLNSDISYESFKGGATSDPAANVSGNGCIRLYQNGGYITITGAKGVTIDQVSITTGSTYASTQLTFAKDDAEPGSDLTTIAKNSTFSVGPGLDCRSFSIYCMGTDKNSRLDIASIEVKYTKQDVELWRLWFEGEYQTTFYQSEEFTHDGMKVIAEYKDGSKQDVTEQAEFSAPDMSQLGEHTVVVEYRENGQYASRTYDIMVIDDPILSIAVGGDYKKVYLYGEEFSFDGAQVLATHESGRVEELRDVTFAYIVADLDVVGTHEAYVLRNDEIVATYSYRILPAATILYESFDKNDGTGGNDGKWSGTIASNNLQTDIVDSEGNTAWTMVKGSGADRCAKFGTGSAMGSATTPALGYEGDVILTFKAAAWNSSSEVTTLTVSVDGGSVADGEETINIVKGEWDEYTVHLSGLTAESKITISATQVSNNRFFLDDVLVYKVVRDDYDGDGDCDVNDVEVLVQKVLHAEDGYSISDVTKLIDKLLPVE